MGFHKILVECSSFTPQMVLAVQRAEWAFPRPFLYIHLFFQNKKSISLELRDIFKNRGVTIMILLLLFLPYSITSIIG
jgi:hypothetical protein